MTLPLLTHMWGIKSLDVRIDHFKQAKMKYVECAKLLINGERTCLNVHT